MTNIIGLHDAEFYAYHGYYPEEREVGGKYLVCIEVNTNFEKGAATDDLLQTLNYETLYAIAKQEMEKPCKLIETVAQNIFTSVQGAFGAQIQALKVVVKKINAPLGGKVAYTYVAIES